MDTVVILEECVFRGYIEKLALQHLEEKTGAIDRLCNRNKNIIGLNLEFELILADYDVPSVVKRTARMSLKLAIEMSLPENAKSMWKELTM